MVSVWLGLGAGSEDPRVTRKEELWPWRGVVPYGFTGKEEKSSMSAE